MKESEAPIPFAQTEASTLDRALFARPLPDSIATLMRYGAGDEAFPPPHWIRMRAPRDPAVGARLIAAWNTLAPLVAAETRPDLPKAWAELGLDASDAVVQRFAAAAIERGLVPNAFAMAYAAASQGRGERFDALFARNDAPVAAHLLRLSALRDHGGMPWSEAFGRTVGAALAGDGALTSTASAWTLRLVAELPDPRARRFLDGLRMSASEAMRDDIATLLADPPTLDNEAPAAPLPTAMDTLELMALDPRNPAARVVGLSRMAELDWPRARRLASSISTEDWELDEVVGALLNHVSYAAMVEDFVRRGLITEAPPHSTDASLTRPSARELLRRCGKVVRFDTTSIEGIVDHDRLAYSIAEAAGFDDIDFLEEFTSDQALLLHAWAGASGLRVELDTRRSVIDPYGLVGLINAVARERGQAGRGLLAAENKGMCDVVVGPDKVLRELVNAGLLWIRAGFKW